MPNKHYAQIRGFEEQDENRAKYWSSHVNEWLAKEDAIHISYESLNGDFEATVKSLAASLGIEEYIVDRIKRPQLHPSFKTDILSRGLRKAKRVSMSSVLGDKYIDESKIVLPSCARKGIVGDWKNHFSDADLEFFLKFAKDTMFKLNYKI